MWDGTDFANTSAIAAASGTYKDISTLATATGAYSASNTELDFHATGVNDAPVNTVPASVSVGVNTPKVITGLQIADVDVGSTAMTVTLAVTHGTLTLLGGSGVTATGSGTASVTLTGTRTNLNTLLATANAVTYTPTTGYDGAATLTMTTNDNFVSPGWYSIGSAQTDTDVVPITVTAVQLAITSITNDTGSSSSDGITNDTTPTITGTSDQPNRPVTVTIGGVSFSVMTDSNGNWTVDTGALNATSGTWNKAVGFTTDGLKNISVSLTGSTGSSTTVTSSVTLDATAPAVLVTSVFGDAVGASGNGTFSGTERGFDTTNYTLSPSVSPLPVISGTTTAEDGQTVTVTLAGKTYTATASAGAWQVAVPSADAVLLSHGNTYAITASVSDKAGNAAVADTNNGVLVNIAPPDVPTVVSQTTLSTTPTLTGLAQKLNGASTLNLATGDALTVVIKDAAGTTTLGTYTLTVGGTSSPAGLTYNTSTGAWSLAVPAGVLISTIPATYNIDVSATAGGATRGDISSSELKVVMAPTITSIPEASTINMVEAASLGGTPVNVGIAGTGAVEGQLITVNWGGQTFTQVLTAADIAANSVAIVVPTATLQAETPANTSETIAVSVSLGNGVNSTATSVAINFVPPTAPIISNTLWASTNTTNTLMGIQEAYYDKQLSAFTATTTGFVIDNKLYYSEAVASANSGTVVRVQLPTTGGVPPAVGDTLTLTWGSVTLTGVTLTATHITTNKYVDFTVPFSTIDSQPFGSVAVTATITSAVSGNSSTPASVNVDWSYDLPVANLTSLGAGIAINGRTASEGTGVGVQGAQGVINVGDINGDGFDDFSISQINTTSGVTTFQYIVYGGSGLSTLELSTLSTAGNTNGFIINGSSDTNTRGGDFNGDGYNDVLIRQNDTTNWVVYGGSVSPGVLNMTNMAATAGFKITRASTANVGSVVGDVNGDGFDDILFNMASGDNFLLYGAANNTNLTLPTVTTGSYTNGFFLGKSGTDTSGGLLATASGDINGDGYSDFVLNSYGTTANGYVVFGGSALTSIALTGLAAASRGFAISGLSSVTASMSYLANNMGDVNGDGLTDFIINGGTATNNTAYVVFGKTGSSAVTVSTLATTSAGFSISAGGVNNAITALDIIGDFNGDGLADMVVSDSGLKVQGVATGGAYVVYGRTSTSPLTMTALQASEGFRIDGYTTNTNFGLAVSAAGDVNGDGFDDLVIAGPWDDPTGRTDAGITRVIYGGVTRLNDMVFQPLNGDAVGTTGADTLVGTSGNNQIVAGDGNDTLIGAGGADVLYGGRGDDTLVINASNIAALMANTGNNAQAIARIDGGNGVDTLEFGSAALNLSTVSNAAIQSIERFNMTGAGASLTMNLLDVLTLSEKNNPFNTASGWTATPTGGAAGWGTVNVGAQVVVDGTTASDLYLNGAWQSMGTVQHTEGGVTKVYKVISDMTRAEAQVLVDGNVKIHMAPTVINTANELAGSLNLTEANSSSGTPVRISLTDTDALSGMTLTLNWGGQTVTVTLSATDISAGYVDVGLTTAQLLAVTAIGASTNVPVSVTLLDGSTTVAQSAAQPIAVNFMVPTTPVIDAAVWSTTNTTSSLSGIPEAAYSLDTTTMPTSTVYVDNTLYYSEVLNATNNGSTILRVQLPTVALNAAVPTVAGDTLTLRWGDQVINVGAVSATNITNNYVDVTLSQATLETQAFGNVVVTAEITSAASGNTSLTSPLTVRWAYDLPVAALHSLSQGFQIEGNVSGGKMGLSNENQGSQNVGDVNGDGFDDIQMTDLSGNRYIVYGGNRLGAMNVADLTAVGNTNGFMIASTGKLQPTRGGDINGDGLSDLLIGDGANSYIIFGKTSSIGKVTLATLGTNGFKFTSTSVINEPSMVGDVNGDGYDDMLFNNSSNFNNYLVFGGTNFTPGGSVALPTALGTGTLATGTGTGTTYVSITNGGSTSSGATLPTLSGDFNGDGYSDFALVQMPTTGIGTGPVYVYYGSSGVSAWNSSSLTLAGNGRGFQISGLTGQNAIKFSTTNAGDINGDGMDDIAFADGTTRAFVLFGKTNSTSVSTADLTAGSGGFIINAGTNTVNSVLTDVDVVGDFNGDGLADFVVSNTNMYTSGVAGGGAYLIYGRTATTALTLDSLEVSEGFRITGYSSTTSMLLGRTATAAGDFNGDGFADLALTTYQGETSGMTSAYLSGAGITRVIYGGVDKLESMTFQSANGDAMGTTGADTLTGTSGNNQIVAGDGNDTLIGAGGADVLYGGRGDDLIVINADNVAKLGTNTGNDTQAIARVDGGSGIDTLRLDGAGIVLDLSLVSGPAIQNIEKLDLTGSGNNTLKLTLQDMLQGFDNANVFNSSNTTSGLAATVSKNQLMVNGDTGDKVVLSDLANWTTGTNVVANGHTYTAYNHNTSAQQLLIDQLVTVSSV